MYTTTNNKTMISRCIEYIYNYVNDVMDIVYVFVYS